MNNKTIIGMPIKLILGYLAIAFFMTGDGFDLAFLSKYITDLGFSSSQASFIISMYGLFAAVSSWLSGVIAEIITAKKAMLLGFILWFIFHLCFLVFGIEIKSYIGLLVFYSLRGFAYPLFLYSFVVMIVLNTSGKQISPALGWFWTVYSIGIGVAGAIIPSFTIDIMGEKATLYLSLVFVGIGGLITLFIKTEQKFSKYNSFEDKFNELKFGITILKNKNILYACIIRIINTLSLFGFAVIMPIMFVSELNYTISQWLQVWAVFFATTVFTNVFWGIIGEYIGWITVIRYFGCIGMAIATLAFYFVPHIFIGNLFVCHLCAVLLGICVACFVQITPILTSIEPEHKGACISVYNLSAGLSNFLAPAIATVFMPFIGIKGVVFIYATCYIIAFILTFAIQCEHESFKSKNPFKKSLSNIAKKQIA